MNRSLHSRGSATSRAAIVAFGVLTMTGCGGPSTHAEPPAELSPDSLLLSVEDVRSIAGFDELSAEGSPALTEPQPDPAAPEPCKAILDQRVIFGPEVSEFRSANYGAPTDTDPGQIRGVAIVSQAIGQYADADAARNAFDALAPAVQECNDMHVKNYEYAANHAGDSTLTLHSNVADIVDHVDGSTLIHVVVIGLSESERIADTIVQKITDRLD